MLQTDYGVKTEFVTLGRLPKWMLDAEGMGKVTDQIQAGKLLCEFGHPDIAGLDDHSIVKRCRDINYNRVCAQTIGITPVYVNATLQGYNVSVQPCGPMHSLLETGNYRLGVRGLKREDGELVELITFDVLPVKNRN
ncbi:hypothetical protein AVT69_gp141 [Pseudomonas phage PhiPA3]|uniref:Uncharacterized protein 143 n=1 Tax=Pseudomonas phage PhiPA3 TaxID=998086 RepID=F8SK16_BPPA3|nr:hypothetical protein AVT69_gp141 [Pseudomonas phage PhiPA3]AEH03566.1 hypothetical protein [Pseudomonas phage PhiPA3]